MRLDRARTTALLAAAVLTAAGWVAATPAAYAAEPQELMTQCLKDSKDYESFKSCYETAEAQEKAKANARDEEACEKVGGRWGDPFGDQPKRCY
ncbi:hypothetical protein [Nocardia brasiliensis]|uniref:hypothetical protein n=1 Tax=Nocardia brasiliensis TaxID=37326 RepID=UPI003672F3DF